MIEVWPVACATGHRPQHLTHEQREWTRAKLDRAARWCRDERGTRVGISGMALGVDLWWAQAVLDAGLELWAYIPCPHQADRWTTHQEREWNALLERATRTRIFGHKQVTAALLHERNDGMVADADAVVAVWRPSKRSGGTWSTVRQAVARGMPGVHVDPERMIVRPRLRVLRNQPVVGSAP